MWIEVEDGYESERERERARACVCVCVKRGWGGVVCSK